MHGINITKFISAQLPGDIYHNTVHWLVNYYTSVIINAQNGEKNLSMPSRQEILANKKPVHFLVNYYKMVIINAWNVQHKVYVL